MKRLRIIKTQFSQVKLGLTIIQKILLRKSYNKIKRITVRRSSYHESIQRFVACKNDSIQDEDQVEEKDLVEASSALLSKGSLFKAKNFTKDGKSQNKNSNPDDKNAQVMKQTFVEQKQEEKAYKMFKKMLREKKKKSLQSLGYTIVTKKVPNSEKKKKKKSKNKHKKSEVLQSTVLAILSKHSIIKKFLKKYSQEKNVDIDEELDRFSREIQKEAWENFQSTWEKEMKEAEDENKKTLAKFIKGSKRPQKLILKRDLSQIWEQEENDQESGKIKNNYKFQFPEKNQENQNQLSSQSQVMQSSQQQAEQPQESLKVEKIQKIVQQKSSEFLKIEKQKNEYLSLKVNSDEKKKVLSINVQKRSLKLVQIERDSKKQQNEDKQPKNQQESNNVIKLNLIENQEEGFKIQKAQMTEPQKENLNTEDPQENKSEEKTIHDILQEKFDQYQKEKEEEDKKKKKKKKIKSKRQSEEKSFSSTDSSDIIEEEELQRMIQNRRKGILGQLAQ